MNCHGVSNKIEKVSYQITFSYVKYVLTLKTGNSRVFVHVSIPSKEKALIGKANKYFIEGECISYEGTMNSEGFVDVFMSNVSLSYGGDSFFEFEGKDEVAMAIKDNGVFEINIKTPNYMKNRSTFSLNAVSSNKENDSRIYAILDNPKISYKGKLFNDKLYITSLN